MLAIWPASAARGRPQLLPEIQLLQPEPSAPGMLLAACYRPWTTLEAIMPPKQGKLLRAQQSLRRCSPGRCRPRFRILLMLTLMLGMQEDVTNPTSGGCGGSKALSRPSTALGFWDSSSSITNRAFTLSQPQSKVTLGSSAWASPLCSRTSLGCRVDRAAARSFAVAVTTCRGQHGPQARC